MYSFCGASTKLLTEVYQKRNVTICLSLQNYFTSTEESNTTEQKVRVCHENQNFDFLIVFLVLLNFLSLLSMIASVKLENLTDNTFFYKSTKRFLCFPTKPVVHRSLIFTLSSNDEHHKLLEEVAEDKAVSHLKENGADPP